MEIEKIDGMSMDIEKTNKEKLKSVFPDCFSEDKLNIDKLLSLCGEYIDNDFEKYKFEWNGKSECLHIMQQRSLATLRPCPQESVNWDTTGNVYIEGDNLEVLKLLQTSYYRKIKMIYIDPPYNTGNDFVYKDDFKEPMERYKEVTSQCTKSNPETMGRYHTNWLNMMYPRLRLAANLLRNDGVCFISIDDNEVHNLRKLCDEVFGEENFINQFIWINNITGRQISGKGAAKTYEFILAYAKSISEIGSFSINIDFAKKVMPDTYKGFKKDVRTDEHGEFAIGDTLYNHNRIFNEATRPNLVFSIFYNEETGDITTGDIGEQKKGYIEIAPHKNGDGFHQYHAWRWSKQKIEKEKYNLIVLPTSSNGYEIYTKIRDFNKTLLKDTITNISNGDTEIKNLFDGRKYFDYPKSVDLMKTLLNSQLDTDDIILDFFSGSATTAHAVMQLNAEDGGNRKFICVQLPELCDEKSEAYKAGYKNICEIGKERIRRAGKKISETGGVIKISSALRPLEDAEKPKKLMFNNLYSEEPNFSFESYCTDNLDIGFRVFKLDTSNLRLWDTTSLKEGELEYLNLRLDKALETLKPDRQEVEMVFEIMLKMGIPLTWKVAQIEIDGLPVWSVSSDELENVLIVCLSNGITADLIEKMVELAPAKLVLAEQAIADDSVMRSATHMLKKHGIALKIV